MSSKIKVSPIFDPWYYEFYFKGLVDYYGKNNVAFDFSDDFMFTLKYSSTKFRKDFFYYEIHSDVGVKKVSISAEDWCDINEEIYSKVDCYGKVNVDAENLNQHSKMLPIGPNFGIRYFSYLGYSILTLQLLLKKRIVNPYIKTYLKLSVKRSFLKAYDIKEKANDKFVFYLNYPWSKHKAVTEMRKKIITQLMKLNDLNKINFEGGFSVRRFGYHAAVKEFSAKRKYNHSLYLNRLKKSSLAINTPAVHDCLGWKLGEYIALHKAILSLPINRIMPGEFKPGTHYHEFTDVEKQFEEELLFLIENQEYAAGLSQNAAMYYKEYLTPKAVIKRIDETLTK